MTALCGGGPSGPLAGVAGVIGFGAFAIEGFITSLGFPEVAGLLAPIIAGLIDINVTEYCATDPPADPGINASIMADAISIPPTLTTFDSQQKILQWFEHRYWWQVCHCTTVTTPAPPTLSNPGTVQTNTGLPKGNYTQCWNVTLPYFVNAYHGTGPFPYQDLYAQGLPSGTPILVNWNGAGVGVIPVNAVPIDSGIQYITSTLTVNEPIVGSTALVTGGTASWNADGSQFTPTFATGVAPTVLIGQPSPQTDSLGAFANTTALRWWSFTVTNEDSVAHTGTISLSFTCPPGVSYASSCCPPDPLLEGELQQILQYVQAIYAGLATAPNSFAEGTVHAGLAGSGSVTFVGVPIALKIQLTTVPSWVGVRVGDPDFYFDVGWLSFGTSEGNYAQERLQLLDQVVTVPVLAGSVGYTLENGVVASITELLAGP